MKKSTRGLFRLVEQRGSVFEQDEVTSTTLEIKLGENYAPRPTWCSGAETEEVAVGQHARGRTDVCLAHVLRSGKSTVSVALNPPGQTLATMVPVGRVWCSTDQPWQIVVFVGRMTDRRRHSER